MGSAARGVEGPGCRHLRPATEDTTLVEVAASAPGESPSYLVRAVRERFPEVREQPVSELLEQARATGRIALGAMERFQIEVWNREPASKALRLVEID